MPVRILRRPRTPWADLLLRLVLQPLWAVPFAFFFGTLFGGSWPAYVQAYQASLVFSLTIGLALWAVRHFVEPRLVRRWPRGRDLGLRIGAIYIATAIVASYLAAFLIHRFVIHGFMGSGRGLLLGSLYTLLFVALFGGINFAIAFYRVAMQQARALERQQVALAQAELRALRAQINPHFLFNALNTIAALAVESPRDAEETTTRLADLLRYALAAAEREHQRFADEWAFVRDYLAIERTRFGERLRLRETVEPGLEAVPVPSLLFQPLVENAVRHGIAPRVEGGTLTLSARRDGETLEVAIEDDGPGFDPAESENGAGIGLRSVRERLRLSGPPHAIHIDSGAGGTRVRVVLPLALPADPTPPGGST